MKYTYPKNKAISILTGIIAGLFILTACSSSGDDAAQIVADEFVAISGKITNFNDAGEPDVQVEGVYTNPGNLLNPTTNSDANGNFSLSVIKNDPVYLQATKTGFATINSLKGALNTGITGLDIGIPTESQAQSVIDTVFSTMPLLQNHAWLVVDIEDPNGDGVSGQTISINNATPFDTAYAECNGTDDGATSTTGPCPSGRTSPMYLAYFIAAGEATVTVDSETQTAPIRMGEITALEFEVATAPVGTVVAGQVKYDADCGSCHAAGSYDVTTSNGGNDLFGKSSLLIADISSYAPAKKAGVVADLTPQEILDLTAFLENL